jgi:hypothetical protein
MFVTSAKRHAQVVEIGLHPVTNPLLSTTASRRSSQNAGLQQQTITDIYCHAGAGPGNLSSYEEISGCLARRRIVRARVAR